MKVVALNLSKPASLAVPASTNRARNTTVTIAPATPANPVAVNYYVEYKLLADTNWTTNPGSGLTQVVTFPSAGTYQFRVKAVDAAISPTFADSPYTLGSNTISVIPPATSVTIIPSSPTPHTQGTAVVFTAAGQGSINYDYRFLRYNGVSWTVVQNYGGGGSVDHAGQYAAR